MSKEYRGVLDPGSVPEKQLLQMVGGVGGVSRTMFIVLAEARTLDGRRGFALFRRKP